MKCCNTYVLMAAMAVSGMSLYAADNSAPFNNGTSTAAQMQQTGGQMADEAAAKSVRNELAKIVNAAAEGNKFSSLTSYLAKADKERLGDSKSQNFDDLNNVINQFRNDFKSKYNQEFDITGEHLRNAMVYAGQDKNSATVAIGRPGGSSADNSGAMNSVNTSANNMANGGATADRTLNTTGATVSNRSGDMSGAGVTSSTSGNRTGPASNGQNSNSTVHGNDTTATPGTKSDGGMATGNGATNGNMSSTNSSANAGANANGTGGSASGSLNSMASAGMSGTTLNLVNEGHVMNAWRISAPQLSSEQLKQNLIKHIQMLDDQKAAWPSDVNQAYQATAYHVLSAFSDNAVATER